MQNSALLHDLVTQVVGQPSADETDKDRAIQRVHRCEADILTPSALAFMRAREATCSSSKPLQHTLPVCRYALRLLDSNLHPKQIQSEDRLVQTLREQTVQQGLPASRYAPTLYIRMATCSVMASVLRAHGLRPAPPLTAVLQTQPAATEAELCDAGRRAAPCPGAPRFHQYGAAA